MTFKYDIVGDYENDTWADGVMYIKIYGGATADPMSLNVNYIFTVTVSTEDVFFPLSWRLNISLYDGEYLMPYKYKIMPGHVFTVGEGAELIIGTLIAYLQILINSYHMPRKRMRPRQMILVLRMFLIANRFTNLIHPSAMVNHRRAEILFYLRPHLWLKMLLGRIGDKVVSPSTPSQCTLHRQHKGRQEQIVIYLSHTQAI